MADIEYPMFNGVRHDWSSIKISLRNKRVLGVKELNYKDNLEGTKVYGTHAQAIGRTRGTYTCEASISLYLAEADLFEEDLGDGFGEVEFDILAQYKEKKLKIITHKIIACRIKSPDLSQSQGADPTVKKYDLDPMLIDWNGRRLVANALGV